MKGQRSYLVTDSESFKAYNTGMRAFTDIAISRDKALLLSSPCLSLFCGSIQGALSRLPAILTGCCVPPCQRTTSCSLIRVRTEVVGVRTGCAPITSLGRLLSKLQSCTMCELWRGDCLYQERRVFAWNVCLRANSVQPREACS